jgi:hypothetical protein
MERCCGCRFWHGGEAMERAECRRYPPPASDHNFSPRSLSHCAPITLATDWCGEYKERTEP